MNSFSILSRTRFLREVWRLDSHTFDRAVFEAGVRDLIKAAEARQLLGVGQNLLCQWSQRFGLEHPWASKRQWVWFSRPRVLFLRAYLEQHGQKSARADGKRWLIDADCQAEIAALLCAVPRTSMGEVAPLLPKKELIVQQEILQISFKSESVSLTQTQ